MSKKAWTVTRIKHPKFPRLTVRVGEFVAGGTLQVFFWANSKQRSRSLSCRRLDLGASKAKQEREARRLGCEFIEVLAKSQTAVVAESSSPLTLGRLLDRYNADGLLRVSKGYRRDTLAAVRRVVDAFGPEMTVTGIKPSHLERYVTRRIREGHAVAGRRDLVALGKACTWAEGEELIIANPLRKEKARAAMRVRTQIARPFYSLEDYQALRAVAPAIKASAFIVLLDLAWHTGRRVGALLSLRWEDLHLQPTPDSDEGRVTWYAGTTPDNKKREQTTYLNKDAHAALFAWRQRSLDATGYLFPARSDSSQPMGRTGPKKWLMKAEQLAGIEHRRHGGWHQCRRGWATARKDWPVKDVMALGGWTDEETLLRSYVHATPRTTRELARFVA